MEAKQQFLVAAQDRKFLPFYDEREKEWTEPFFFIQAADTQLGMQERYIEGREEFGWSQEVAWTQQMVRDVNAMTPKPKFLVVCGDLLDAWPATEADTRRRQERDFKQVLAGLEVPLVCVCGNHDIGNTPTPETVAAYNASFGDDFFSFWCGGVFFLVVNSQYWEDASRTRELAAEQEAWLERQLEVVRRQRPRHAVVFQHIPYFLSRPDEDKEYFNMEPALRQALLRRLHDAGVRYVFCGHYHRNTGGFYRDLEEVVTSAVGAQLGDDHHGFRLVKVLHDRLEHRYYPLGAAPTRVHLPQAAKTEAAPSPAGPRDRSHSYPGPARRPALIP